MWLLAYFVVFLKLNKLKVIVGLLIFMLMMFSYKNSCFLRKDGGLIVCFVPPCHLIG